VIGLNHQLKEGETVSLTLQFSNDMRKSIKVPVEPRSAMMKEG
jgi:copper(I)-binding protein